MRTRLTATLVLILAGCASSGPRIDPSRLDQVRKGQSTVTQIVNEFGRPTVLSRNMDGSQIAAYMFKDGRGGTAGFVPLVGALAGSSDANVDSVIFYFDAKGILTDYKTTQASAATKTLPAEPARSAQPAPAAPAPVGAAPASAAPAAQAGVTKAPEAHAGNRTLLNLPSLLPSATRDPRAPD